MRVENKEDAILIFETLRGMVLAGDVFLKNKKDIKVVTDALEYLKKNLK